ncbi:MAG: NAD-dependent epimerase/dehydratase family protein [Paracoccus sp. (in: a-proteobacteria)]|uniref:NAD-dependent epimerase/dehydratase family protein n=1 Tax=Paracoccus sp. TaxID=267 RepID=UPI0026DEF857|nr:NAD-dependent epimerase/dehydratase family protein [Paracoccus sp. (in: a-proteobacteria)]MDO5631722.1 NAD-dependent epimerase/dehydratase family protein [Paracoccus sp. (in: a-proteobacteria)]
MRVWLTGGNGLLGRAIRRQAGGVTLLAPSRAELDLTDRAAVAAWLAANPVDAVIHAAARVGGIAANIADPAGFLTDNLRMNDAVITGADAAGVGRLLFIGSSCVYPRDYRQPLGETDLMAAPLEPTNEGYALAKLAGMRLCDYISGSGSGRAYRSLIPCNLFGVDDHFGTAGAHLLAAAIHKIVAAQTAGADTVEIWGSGTARREFLEADHLARFVLDALPRLADLPSVLNIGAGVDRSVAEWYGLIAELAGWHGRFTFDLTRPEGMRAKLLSSARAAQHGYAPPADIRPALSRAIAACREKMT